MNMRTIGWGRGIGFLIGLAVGLAAVLTWRIPAGTGTLGTDLIVSIAQTGELSVSQPGPFVTANGMRPGGDEATGAVTVHNHSGSDLAVALEASPSLRDLDDLLRFEISAGGRELFSGTVGALRASTQRTFVLSPGQTQTLAVRAWLPASVQGGYQGRIATVDLTMLPKVVTR